MDVEASKTNDAEADGEVVWSWRPDAGVKFRGTIREATVAKEPRHRGEHEANRKAVAQGMSDCSAYLW
jgi:hypothetical protein